MYSKLDRNGNEAINIDDLMLSKNNNDKNDNIFKDINWFHWIIQCFPIFLKKIIVFDGEIKIVNRKKCSYWMGIVLSWIFLNFDISMRIWYFIQVFWKDSNEFVEVSYDVYIMGFNVFQSISRYISFIYFRYYFQYEYIQWFMDNITKIGKEMKYISIRFGTILVVYLILYVFQSLYYLHSKDELYGLNQSIVTIYTIVWCLFDLIVMYLPNLFTQFIFSIYYLYFQLILSNLKLELLQENPNITNILYKYRNNIIKHKNIFEFGKYFYLFNILAQMSFLWFNVSDFIDTNDKTAYNISLFLITNTSLFIITLELCIAGIFLTKQYYHFMDFLIQYRFNDIFKDLTDNNKLEYIYFIKYAQKHPLNASIFQWEISTSNILKLIFAFAVVKAISYSWTILF